MDRRTARTQKALIAALQTCLHQRPWEEITVQMLCDAADISRSTFYAHYETKQDLLAAGMAQISSHLGLEETSGRGLDLNGTLRILPPLLRHMRGSLSLFDRTRASMPGRELSYQFEQAIGGIIRQEVEQSAIGTTVRSDQLTFLLGGLFAMLDDWRIARCETPDDAMLVRLDRLASRVLAPD